MPLHCKIFMSDYETALHIGFAQVATADMVAGWFHFTQAQTKSNLFLFIGKLQLHEQKKPFHSCKYGLNTEDESTVRN